MQLLDDNIVYVGETSSGTVYKHDDHGRFSSTIFKDSVRLGIPEVWSEGGFYFSKLSKLQEIENKIGIFHKGDCNVKYKHILDGIDYGEVGFPTLLYHNDLNFNVLKRDDYFINEW